MARAHVQVDDEAQSYSAFYPSLGASILSAALLQAAVPPHPVDMVQSERPVWIYQADNNRFAHSYQATVVEQGSNERQLRGALQSLYDELASSQVELEADTKKVLYSNLWSLYA